MIYSVNFSIVSRIAKLMLMIHLCRWAIVGRYIYSDTLVVKLTW
jgi:hypothetical protein